MSSSTLRNRHTRTRRRAAFSFAANRCSI